MKKNSLVEYVNNLLNQNNCFVERMKLFCCILQQFINHSIYVLSILIYRYLNN